MSLVSLCYNSELLVNGLLLADSEYLGMTFGTRPLCGWPTVLHFDRPGIHDLHLFPTLHTISLHLYLLFEFAKRLARIDETVKRVAVCFSYFVIRNTI